MIIIMLSCTPEIQPIVYTPLPPLPTKSVIPEVLSPDAQLFQNTVSYYEQQITACLDVETGEYLGDDVAMLFWKDLQNDGTLFNNSQFVKVWNWFMDDIETYCSHIAVEDPPTSLGILNILFEKIDAEYYQFQRQGRIGIQDKNVELIESAFRHREEAHLLMKEAEYYYQSLFEAY